MNDPRVVVFGLGYIGLPTSALIASKKIKVLGVDILNKVVETINEGKIHIVEPDLAGLVKYVVDTGYFCADTKPKKGDVFLITVPTPFKDDHEPDISYVESAIRSISDFLERDNLIIIESTSPVGTTEKMQSLVNKLRPDLKENYFLAYCPERVLPGKILHELVTNDRVIGGISRASTQKAIEFYKLFVNGNLHITNSRTAEMCKLVENSSRDNQIAFANELSIICNKANIDVWELINLANKHPRVNILQPGTGVGGHCIAVDPWFIVSEFPNEAKIIRAARELNNYKTLWVIENIRSAIKKFKNANNKKAVVALMGLAFKPNIDDLRESPAKKVVDELINNDEAEFLITEPNINSHRKIKLINYYNAYKKADIVAFLVAHREFYSLDKDNKKIELDFCGVRK